MIRMAWLAIKFLVSALLLTFSAAMAIKSAKADDNGFLHTHYDGVTNDLLTAGLGKSGLGSPVARVRGSAPTDSRGACGGLRSTTITGRSSILRQAVDFGLLYGPNVTANGTGDHRRKRLNRGRRVPRLRERR